jgi:hypothetical protein
MGEEPIKVSYGQGFNFDRVDNQIAWYEKNANRMMRRLNALKLTQILFGAAIPICALLAGALGSAQIANIINGILGSLIAAIETYLQFRQVRPNWVRLRAAAEALKREKSLFSQNAGPYEGMDGIKAASKFAAVVEDIISGEFSRFVSLIHPPKESKAGNQTTPEAAEARQESLKDPVS